MVFDKAKLTQPFPKEALKQRQGGGGKTLTYVETHTVIHRLNVATANCWDFKLTRLDQVGDLYVAVGELTIPGLGTRTGIGVQRVVERSGEDLVKGAASDCLKKCATLFGVGLELYGPDYEAVEIAAPPVNGRTAAELVRPAATSERAPSLYPATREQLNKDLHREADLRGLSHADLHAIVVDRGYKSVADLTVPQLEKFVKWVRSSEPPAIQAAIDAGRDPATLGAK